MSDSKNQTTQSVPEGCKLVPVKPTIEMVEENAAAPTVKAEQVLCSEERPCIPCFTDNGECAAASSLPAVQDKHPTTEGKEHE